ncbi:DUF86 domain-containing protein [bacterium]|nr:DUF86 domain-containing protein [bacterium]
MRTDKKRFEDILDSAIKIERYAVRGKDEFLHEELIQNWMFRQLEIIGEAANNISLDLQKKYSDLPWRQMIGLRHVLVHQYFEIDLDVIWKIIEEDICVLEKRIREILEEL